MENKIPNTIPDNVVQFIGKPDFAKDTMNMINASVETLAKNSDLPKKNDSIDYISSVVDTLYEKVNAELDTMNYLEIINLKNNLGSERDTVKTTLSIANSMTSLASTMAGMSQDPLAAKIELAKMMGDQSITGFKKDGEKMITEMERTIALLDDTLESQYKDVKVTSKFFAEQMTATLGKKLKRITENEEGYSEFAVNEAKAIIAAEMKINCERTNIFENASEYLFKPYGRLIRKAKQYCRNLPDETFKETRDTLKRHFDENRMAALEWTIVNSWKNPNTVCPFFTFLNMVLQRADNSSRYAAAHSVITVMIMNACDFATKIWDYDMTLEEYLEEFKKVEDIFTIAK